MIPGPLVQAMIGHALGRAFGPDDEKEEQRKDTEQADGGRRGSDGPRCAVCGGPAPDGSGCEFCPKVFGEEVTV